MAFGGRQVVAGTSRIGRRRRYLWVQSRYTGKGHLFLFGLHEGGSEECVHYAGPVALARVVKHVLGRAVGLVGVDLLAE